HAEVVLGMAGRVQVAVGRRELLVARLQALRAEVPEHAPVEGVRPALGDDVDDAARRLAVLGLEAGGLDLGLLDEVRGHARPQCAEYDRVGPGAAVPRVRDVHAVDDVAVLQAAGAGDGGVGPAHAAAGADAGNEVEGLGEVPAHGQPLERLGVEGPAHG